jgi:hypothetical protein
MPVDAEPTPDGTVEVFRHGGAVLCRVLTDPPLIGGVNLRTSHFATCPYADEHRNDQAR